MTTASTATRPAGRPVARVAVLLPLLISAAGAVLVLAIVPSAWGVADEVGLASWAPAAGLLVLSLPVLVIDGLALPAAWRRARGLFEVTLTQAAIGVVGHWGAALSMVLFAATAGSKDSYQSLGLDGTSTSGFVFFAVLLAAILHATLGGLTFIYLWSIEPGPTKRPAERSPGNATSSTSGRAGVAGLAFEMAG